MPNVRRNLAVQIVPIGGSNPLKMRIVATGFIAGTTGITGALIGQGGTPAYAYSIVSGTLPTGLSLSSTTGIISGTPSASGSFTFTAQIQDAALTAYAATFSIAVTNPLSFSGALVGADPGKAYSQAVIIAGATGTVTFTAAGPVNGLSVSTTGLVTGTPGAIGTVSLSTTASDSGTGASLAITLKIVVNPVPLTISPVGVWVNNLVNQTNTRDVTIIGGTGPYTATVSSNFNEATLLMLNSGNGFGSTCSIRILYTPSSANFPNSSGSDVVSLTVTDGYGTTTNFPITTGVINTHANNQGQQDLVNVGSLGITRFNIVSTNGLKASANTNTLTIDANTASATQTGMLLAADWTAFNNGIVTATAQTWAGDKTFSNNIVPSATIKWLTSVGFPATLSTNGTAYDYVSAINGRVIYGCGSTWDVLIANRGGSVVMGVTPNTQNAQFGGNVSLNNGNLDITLAGKGLMVAEGSNAKQGTATLVAGTVTVSNTSVTANSRIFLTAQNNGGTIGFLSISARTAGTSFTIKSSSASDTSLVAYEIFEPG